LTKAKLGVASDPAPLLRVLVAIDVILLCIGLNFATSILRSVMHLKIPKTRPPARQLALVGSAVGQVCASHLPRRACLAAQIHAVSSGFGSRRGTL
jgi:hypothetical protein